MIILLFHQINFFYIYLLPIFINIDFPNIFKHLLSNTYHLFLNYYHCWNTYMYILNEYYSFKPVKQLYLNYMDNASRESLRVKGKRMAWIIKGN